MRTVLIIGMMLASISPAIAQTTSAEIAFTNRRGEAELWRVTDTSTQDRFVRQYSTSAGDVFFRETVELSDAGILRIAVADLRPEGESVDIQVDRQSVRFSLADGSSTEETTAYPVWTPSTFGMALVRDLNADGNRRLFNFSVPIAKARKTAPMEARIIAVNPETVEVEIRSTSLIVQAFFMRGPFLATLERETGRIVKFAGQPEAYDYSSGRARSIVVEYEMKGSS